MGLMDRIKQAFSRTVTAVVAQPVFRNAEIHADIETLKNYELVKHYRHWVFVCASKNAQAVASVPLRLYVTTSAGQKAYPNLRKGIDTKPVSRKKLTWLKESKQHKWLQLNKLNKAVMVEEVVDHPFLTLWQKANQYDDGFELLNKLQMFAELTGDGYLWMQLDNLGIPQSLWILQSQWLTIVPEKEGEGFIRGYLYGKERHNRVALAPEEVLHVKFPNPFDIYYGFSPMQAVWMAVQRKEAYDLYEQSLLKNNGRPDFVIKHKQNLKRKQIKQLREEWMQLYGGRKTGLPAVLTGELDLQEVGFKPRDMQNTTGRKITREEILAAYGVPMSKVTSEDVNLANAQIGEVQYQRDTIKGRLVMVQDKLNQDLMPKYDERLFVAFDENIPQDEQFEHEKSTDYLDRGVITINEVREQEGKEPVEWGDSAWMDFNKIPVSSSESTRPDMQSNQDNEGKSTSVHLHMIDGSKQVKQIDTSVWFWQAVPKMASTMKDIFAKMEKDLIRILQEQKSLVPNGINKQGEGLVIWSEEMFQREKWAALVNAEMGEQIRNQLIRGGVRAAQGLGAGISFNILNPEIVTFLDEYTFKFAERIVANVSAEFASQMTQGFEAGESIPELTTRTRNFFQGMKTWKAEQIARTESTRAAHRGMVESWKQSKVVSATIWDAQADACPFCTDIDGKTVALGANFFEEGESLTVPDAGTLNFNYEPVLSPPLHPNCRCTLRAEIREG